MAEIKRWKLGVDIDTILHADDAKKGLNELEKDREVKITAKLTADQAKKELTNIRKGIKKVGEELDKAYSANDSSAIEDLEDELKALKRRRDYLNQIVQEQKQAAQAQIESAQALEAVEKDKQKIAKDTAQIQKKANKDAIDGAKDQAKAVEGVAKAQEKASKAVIEAKKKEIAAVRELINETRGSITLHVDDRTDLKGILADAKKVNDVLSQVEEHCRDAVNEVKSMDLTKDAFYGRNLNGKRQFQNAIREAWNTGEKNKAAKLFEQYQIKFPDGKFNPDQAFGASWTNSFDSRLNDVDKFLAGLRERRAEFADELELFDAATPLRFAKKDLERQHRRVYILSGEAQNHDEAEQKRQEYLNSQLSVIEDTARSAQHASEVIVEGTKAEITEAKKLLQIRKEIADLHSENMAKRNQLRTATGLDQFDSNQIKEIAKTNNEVAQLYNDYLDNTQKLADKNSEKGVLINALSKNEIFDEQDALNKEYDSIGRELDQLEGKYYNIISAVRQWIQLQQKMEPMFAEGNAAAIRKNVIKALQGVSPEVAAVIGKGFEQGLANGFKGIKTKEIHGMLNRVVNSNIMGGVSSGLNMFEGLDLKDFDLTYFTDEYQTGFTPFKQIVDILGQIQTKREQQLAITQEETDLQWRLFDVMGKETELRNSQVTDEDLKRIEAENQARAERVALMQKERKEANKFKVADTEEGMLEQLRALDKARDWSDESISILDTEEYTQYAQILDALIVKCGNVGDAFRMLGRITMENPSNYLREWSTSGAMSKLIYDDLLSNRQLSPEDIGFIDDHIEMMEFYSERRPEKSVCEYIAQTIIGDSVIIQQKKQGLENQLKELEGLVYGYEHMLNQREDYLYSTGLNPMSVRWELEDDNVYAGIKSQRDMALSSAEAVKDQLKLINHSTVELEPVVTDDFAKKFEASVIDKLVPIHISPEQFFDVNVPSNLTDAKLYSADERDTQRNAQRQPEFYAMSKQDATDYLFANYDEKLWNDWFLQGFDSARTEIAKRLDNDSKLKNASLNQMWHVFKEQNGSDISYDDFLNSKIPLYRGERAIDLFGNVGESTTEFAASFSLSADIAKDFAGRLDSTLGNVLEVFISPKDTLGMPRPKNYGETGESYGEIEVLVPMHQIDGSPEYIDFKQKLKEKQERYSMDKDVKEVNQLITSYEELCQVVERYNELETKDIHRSTDEDYEYQSLSDRLHATIEKQNIPLSKVWDTLNPGGTYDIEKFSKLFDFQANERGEAIKQEMAQLLSYYQQNEKQINDTTGGANKYANVLGQVGSGALTAAEAIDILNKEIAENNALTEQTNEGSSRHQDEITAAQEELAIEQQITAEKKKQSQAEQIADIPVTQDIFEKDTDRALKQIREAKDNKTSLVDFSGVFDTEDLEDELRNMANLAIDKDGYVVDNVRVKDSVAVIKLYNDALKTSVTQTYQLTAASEDAAAELQFIGEEIKHNVKALREGQLDVDFEQRFAKAQIKNLIQPLNGAQYKGEGRLRELADGIVDAASLKEFNQEIKIAKTEIGTLKKKLASDLDTTTKMSNTMLKAEGTIRSYRQEYEKLQHTVGSEVLSNSVNDMEAAWKTYHDTDDLEEQVKAFNKYDQAKKLFDANVKSVRNTYASDEASQKQSENSIKSYYRTLSSTFNQISSLDSKLNTLKIKDDGTGTFLPLIQNLEEQKSQLLSKVHEIGKDMGQALGGTFEQGYEVELPLNNLVNESDAAVITDFFNDARVQAALTEKDIDSLAFSLQKSQNNLEEFGLKLVDKVGDVRNAANTLASLKEDGVISKDSEYYQVASSKMANFFNYKSTLDPDASNWSGKEALIFQYFANDAIEYTDALNKTIQKEAQYFANHKKYTTAANVYNAFQNIGGGSDNLDDNHAIIKYGDQVDEFTSTKDKLIGAANDIAKEFNASGAIVTNFAETAEGIAKLDFSFFDEGTKSLRQFSIAKSALSDDMHVIDNSINQTAKKIQAADQQVKKMDSLLSTLQGNGFKIEGDEAHSSVQRLLRLTQELSNAIHSDKPELIEKITQEAKIATAEVQRLYNESIKTKNAMEDGSMFELGKYVDANGMADYDQLTDAVHKFAAEQDNATLKVGKFNEKTGELNYTMTDGSGNVHHYTASINKLGKSINAQQKGVTKLQTGWKHFSSILSHSAKQMLMAFSGYDVFTRVVHTVRQGITYIKDIDLAMTELKKVTDETKTSYAQFLETAAQTGSKIGATTSDFVNATADFARIGYTMHEAGKMAEAAIVYKNVADGLDTVEAATESITSTMKAFGIESYDTMSIIDSFNEVGNNFAITSAGIGEALKRSASALHEGGNTMQQSIGLITGANTVVQDPEVVGTALKTLSLRIRGVKTELQEAGLDAENMAETTAQLQAKLLALTGGKVDIMINEDEFKSTYDILEDMSKVWKDMTDVEQAAALELIGGKLFTSMYSNVHLSTHLIAGNS